MIAAGDIFIDGAGDITTTSIDSSAGTAVVVGNGGGQFNLGTVAAGVSVGLFGSGNITTTSIDAASGVVFVSGTGGGILDLGAVSAGDTVASSGSADIDVLSVAEFRENHILQVNTLCDRGLAFQQLDIN